MSVRSALAAYTPRRLWAPRRPLHARNHFISLPAAAEHTKSEDALGALPTCRRQREPRGRGRAQCEWPKTRHNRLE